MKIAYDMSRNYYTLSMIAYEKLLAYIKIV
jgi:hypothetical protein